MSTPTLKTRKELTEEWIRRFLTYTSEITWFGGNGVMRAVAIATGSLASTAFRLYVALTRRITLMGSKDADLTLVAAERGTERLEKQRARLLVVVVPHTANVDGVRVVGPNSQIEIDDSTEFLATYSVRIRSQDGATTEVFTVVSISVGTGLVNGNDELVLAGLLANAYSPASEDVDVLLRHTVAAGTAISTTVGVSFETLDAVTVGDSNPVLDGEGTALSLADKVWCESVTTGISSEIEPLSVLDFTTPIAKIKSIYNPEAGAGGADVERDFDLRYRASHFPTIQNQETLSWVEATAQQINTEVLRAIPSGQLELGELSVKLLRRNGGTFSAALLTESGTGVDQRARSYMTVTPSNVTLTSVEVEAQITIEADAVFETVWRAAASRLADFIDFRKWEWGADVDEAELLAIVRQTPGVASLVTSTFLPASDVAVAATSLPTLTRLSLQDTTSGETINATLAQGF